MKIRINLDEDVAPQRQAQEQEESLPGFLGRQIAKTPAVATRLPGMVGNIQQDVRSVLGMEKKEDPLQALTRDLGLDLPNEGAFNILREGKEPVTGFNAPTSEQIRQAQKGLAEQFVSPERAEYLTGTRPGLAEAGIEFLQEQALPVGAALRGIMSTGKTLGQAALQVGKSLLGATAGGLAAEKGTEIAGFSPASQRLAGAAGSVGGGLAAHYFSERSLSKIGPKAFELEKKNQIKTLDAVKAAELAELEKEKALYDSRIKSLEESRTKGYKAAESAASGIEAPATNLVQELNKLRDQIGTGGIEETEQNRIFKLLDQVEDTVRQGKLKLQDAINLKKNLIASTYDKSLPSSLRNSNKQVIHHLNEFIKEVGEKNPEHGKPFSAAESETRQLKELQKEQKQFHKDYEKATKELNKQYDTERKILESKDYKEWRKENLENFGSLWKELGKDWHDAYKLSELPLHALATYLGGPLGAALSKVGVKAFKVNSRSMRLVTKLLKDHPELRADLHATVAAISEKNLPAFQAGFRKLDEDFNKIQQSSSDKEPEEEVFRFR